MHLIGRIAHDCLARGERLPDRFVELNVLATVVGPVVSDSPVDRSIAVGQFKDLSSVIAMSDLLRIDPLVVRVSVLNECERAHRGMFDRMRAISQPASARIARCSTSIQPLSM